jgi:hypothetical protein
MKTATLCICLLFVIPFLIGCGKQEFQYPDSMLWAIPDGALSYFYFQPNSYWVYKNDKTGQLDTQIIVSATRVWFKQAAEQGYERAEVKMQSSFENLSFDHTAVYDVCPDSCCWLQTGKQNEGYFATWRYPFSVGYSGWSKHTTTDSSRFTVLDKFDSLLLNNVMFYEVVKINTTKATIFYKKDINMYWAKGIGIIKKENLTDNETWNLIDFNIVN